VTSTKYWVIDAGALHGKLDGNTGHYKNLGNLAHHFWEGDGVLKARYNTVTQSAQIEALGRVVATNAEDGTASISWHAVGFELIPGPQGRRHWETSAYFILNAQRARSYELPEKFAKAFGDNTWLTHKIIDSFHHRNELGGRLPTLDVREGFVYLMQWENEYKIGKAVDIERRKKRLSRELNRDITVLHRIFSHDYTRAESDLHRKYASKRLHGEWFALEADDITWLMSIDQL
jgi:hypothetical protein